MMLITCPWCGPREELEFRCGGESHISRPTAPQSISDEGWGNYLFMRKNPRGTHNERWVHASGCRRWFNVARDTATHEIEAIYQMHEPAPSQVDGL